MHLSSVNAHNICSAEIFLKVFRHIDISLGEVDVYFQTVLQAFATTTALPKTPR